MHAFGTVRHGAFPPCGMVKGEPGRRLSKACRAPPAAAEALKRCPAGFGWAAGILPRECPREACLGPVGLPTANVALFDRGAGKGTGSRPDNRAECRGMSARDQAAEGAARDTADDKPGRAVGTAAIILAVLSDVDAIVRAEDAFAILRT